MVTIIWRTLTITTITIIRIITRRWWRITITARRPTETSPPLRITTRLRWPRRPSRGGSRPPIAATATTPDDNGYQRLKRITRLPPPPPGTTGRKIYLFFSELPSSITTRVHTHRSLSKRFYVSLWRGDSKRVVRCRVTVFFQLSFSITMYEVGATCDFNVINYIIIIVYDFFFF